MRSGSLLLGCAALLAFAPAAYAADEKGGARALERRVPSAAAFVPGELVVKFRAGTSSAARADALGRARVARSLDAPGLTLVRLPRGAAVRASALALAGDPDVAFAEPNYVYRLATTPDDPFFSDGTLWGLHQDSGADIDAPAAWDTTTGSADVVVAVVDTGVAYDHPDLADNMWANGGETAGDAVDNDGNGFVDDVLGWDFVEEDAAPLDTNGHGTHVAGTIGAVGNNGTGVTGVNWDVSLMALRAGNGRGVLTGADIYAAFQYACAEGADVVNGSFGGSGKSQALANLIASAQCRNTLFVFAAGNDGRNLTTNAASANAYPCEYHRPAPYGYGVRNIVCVGATNPNDALASFSNRGPAAVHLGAPGVAIASAWPGYEAVGTVDDLETDGTWGDPINVQRGTSVPPTWGRSNVEASSPMWSLADSPGLGGRYVNDALTTIRNADPIDLTGRFGCLVDYDLMLETESGFDWFGLLAGTDADADDVELDAFSGTTEDEFVRLSTNLTAFDGEPEVYLRFFLESDNVIRMDGAHVDDVLVRCVTPSVEGYEESAGTSMAAPHVAGVAALLLAAKPGLSVARLKNALLRGVDRKSALTSHFSSGGRLNADRSLTVVHDETSPNTTITARPNNRTTSRRATFRFRSSESGSTFQCRHMNGAWRSCSSPKTYRRLAPGRHTFRVRAVDRNLNVDPTPAVDTWRVRR